MKFNELLFEKDLWQKIIDIKDEAEAKALVKSLIECHQFWVEIYKKESYDKGQDELRDSFRKLMRSSDYDESGVSMD